MSHNLSIHHRRSIRLKRYDYTQPGAYFVTVVSKNRECLFGNVSDDAMITNDNGSIIQSVWFELPGRFPNIVLDAFIVIPNHIHCIIDILDVGARSPRPGPLVAGSPRSGPSGAGKPRPYVVNMPPENNLTHPPTLGQIVAFFKYQTTKHVNQIRGTHGTPVWQRNYWEHIIRNEDELSRIREYIRNNPVAWETDDEYPHPH